MTEMYHSKRYDPIGAQVEATLEGYMQRKHDSLGNDYRTEDGKYLDHCALIAFDIAFSLVEAGREPSIAALKGREIRKGGWIGNESLKPTRYDGRVTWGGHTVCVCDGLAYDPMVSPKPVPIDEYPGLAFTNDTILMNTDYLDTDYIRARLGENKERAQT